MQTRRWKFESSLGRSVYGRGRIEIGEHLWKLFISWNSRRQWLTLEYNLCYIDQNRHITDVIVVNKSAQHCRKHWAYTLKASIGLVRPMAIDLSCDQGFGHYTIKILSLINLTHMKAMRHSGRPPKTIITRFMSCINGKCAIIAWAKNSNTDHQVTAIIYVASPTVY